MSDLRSQLIRLAHANPAMRPHLLPIIAAESKTAHGPIALRNPDVMLFAIDHEKNQSKFYEMAVVSNPTGGVTLQKRWGRLTDTGATGRVDSKDEYFDNEAQARSAMEGHKRAKMRGAGSAAYTDVSRTREYPIGRGAAGFGWGGQAACTYIPEIQELHTQVEQTIRMMSRYKETVAVIAKKDSSMGRKLLGQLEGVMGGMMEMDKYLEEQLSHCS